MGKLKLSHSLRCRLVHLIEETNTGDVVLLCLSPHGQSLSLLVFSKGKKKHNDQSLKPIF